MAIDGVLCTLIRIMPGFVEVLFSAKTMFEEPPEPEPEFMY
jgi:hypothetical protein